MRGRTGGPEGRRREREGPNTGVVLYELTEGGVRHPPSEDEDDSSGRNEGTGEPWWGPRLWWGHGRERVVTGWVHRVEEGMVV